MHGVEEAERTLTVTRQALADRGALELTILMPCLNEARTLAACVRKARSFLQQACVSGEVLVADNGSDDGSALIAQAEGARVVAVPTRGYGAALKASSRQGVASS